MPELPRQMAERFVAEYGLPEYDATTLTQSPAMAAYFETAAKLLDGSSGQAKMASNWIMGEVSRRLNAEGKGISDAPVQAEQLAVVLKALNRGEINAGGAKHLFDLFWTGKRTLVAGSFQQMEEKTKIFIELDNLKQMNDSGALEAIIDKVMADNVPMVEQFRAGKDKAFNALVGLVMKASKGKANPQQVNDVLKQKLQ
jgi:aspartyl-tRNA(Asn)/glutamyl-tRNA(Gln) amidotransferase subunit B